MLGTLVGAAVVAAGLYIVTAVTWHLYKSSWCEQHVPVTREKVMTKFRLSLGWYAIAVVAIVTKVWGDGKTTSSAAIQMFCVLVSVALYVTNFMTNLDGQIAELQARERVYLRGS